jgi:superfamily I DNA/RNA helicase
MLVAGAGSGKTSVLTERFVYLVSERGVDPERILTITFTRTATAEMKARIIRKLEARGLRDARHRIESAYIHTVHALCRRLLQENPFEAGVDPDPAVLSAHQSQSLRLEAFHRALENLLRNETPTGATPASQDALRALIAEYLMLGEARARSDPLQTLYQMVRHLVDESRHQGLDLPRPARMGIHTGRDATPPSRGRPGSPRAITPASLAAISMRISRAVPAAEGGTGRARFR